MCCHACKFVSGNGPKPWFPFAFSFPKGRQLKERSKSACPGSGGVALRDQRRPGQDRRCLWGQVRQRGAVFRAHRAKHRPSKIRGKHGFEFPWICTLGLGVLQRQELSKSSLKVPSVRQLGLGLGGGGENKDTEHGTISKKHTCTWKTPLELHSTWLTCKGPLSSKHRDLVFTILKQSFVSFFRLEAGSN